MKRKQEERVKFNQCGLELLAFYDILSVYSAAFFALKVFSNDPLFHSMAV